jgi:hypothetical protein
VLKQDRREISRAAAEAQKMADYILGFHPDYADPVQRQTIHVDEMGRRLDFELHEVEQVCAAGNELDAVSASGHGGSAGRARALVGEGPHAFLPATSVIASMMLE